MGSYKYLKEKKNTNGRLKKKSVVAIVATVPLEQPKWHCSNYSKLGKKNGSLHQKRHGRGIASSYIVSRKNSTNQWLKKKKKST